MLTLTSLQANANVFASIVCNGVFTDRDGKDVATDDAFARLLKVFARVRAQNGTVYVVGNGGSAAVAGHATTDFFKTGGMRAMTLHDPSTLTCFANDYGYENAYSYRLDRLLRASDLLVAISSSGKSPNILNSAASAEACGSTIITLSGFKPDNPLRRAGALNYWLNSDDYGMVEIGHLFVLHYLADRLAMQWERGDGK
jgi:D-sedoheptulose 7-phosphate isomerase